MKQSTSTSTHNSLSTLFDDDGMAVSEILLQLPHLFLESESRHRFSFTWGAKRRRSAIDASPSPSRVRSKSTPSILGTCVGEDERPISKAEATSPATPLSFSPSESDDKSKHSLINISKKRKKEEWLEMIAELTQRRELLKGEIETVKHYYDKVKAINLELKARKQEPSLCRNEEKPYLGMNKSSNLAMEVAQSPPIPTAENQEHHQILTMVHQPSSIMDRTAYKSEICGSIQYPCGQITPLLSSSTVLGKVTHMGPLGIPDLNVSFEESFGMDSFQPFDMKDLDKAMAAQARKKRMQIYKVKNSIAASKPRYGHR